MALDSRWGFLLGLWALSGYFGAHAILGSRGILVWQEKQERVILLANTLKDLQMQRDRWLQKISLIQDAIDPDLLEQLAWTLFRLIDPQKRVILCP
jgi:hypothetical protein